MSWSRATSSDNLSKISTGPFTTYSAPSTPLPATLTTVSVQGLNWVSSSEMTHNTEFPWNISALTPTTPSSTGTSDVLLNSDGSNYMYNEPVQTTDILKNASTNAKPLPSTEECALRLSSDYRTTLRTNWKLQLPPVNQEALLQAALSSHLVPRTSDASPLGLDSVIYKLQTGVQKTITAGSMHGPCSEVGSSTKLGDMTTQLSHDATCLLSNSPMLPLELQRSERREIVALLTPPDETSDMITQSLPAACTSQPALSTTYSIQPSLIAEEPMLTNPDVKASHDICAGETDRGNLFTHLAQDEEWLRNALSIMFTGCEKSFRGGYEALRMISHSLPCPLPPQQDRDRLVLQPDMPLSASAAPAMAASAGYFFAPSILNQEETPRVLTKQQQAKGGTTTALRTLISAIQRIHKEDDLPVFIQVSHAIPSNIPLSRLPSQPLTDSGMHSMTSSTSASLYGSLFGAQSIGESNDSNTFMSTIFNSLVIVRNDANKHIKSPKRRLNSHRPKPTPMLPPCSLHYSLLERYIPPPSTTSDLELFSTNSSILLDRVYELSSNGGCLLFIYPTKTGAKQFCENYLGPVLDPLLRRLMVMHRLKDDLLWQISRMIAVDNMLEFEGLEKRLTKFCDTLSATTKSSDQSSITIPLSLIHKEKTRIHLNDHSWREWWTQQEQGRIRELVKDYFSRATTEEENQHIRNLSGISNMSLGEATISSIPQYNVPSDLVREIVDGVKATNMQPSSRVMGQAVAASSMVGPTNAWPIVGDTSSSLLGTRNENEGIEVGVFVLQRTG